MSVTYIAKEVKSQTADKYNANSIWWDNTQCRVSGSSSYQYRAFVQHDISGIPSLSRIISAKLYVYATTGNDYTANAKHKFDYITSNWAEDTLTWNNQPSLANAAFPENWLSAPSLGAWNSWDVTEAVQNWVDGTYVNYGLQFINYNESAYRTNWDFYRRHYDADYATYIEVEYEPAPNWSISLERITELADEVRRIRNTDGKLTPEEMVTNLKGVILQEKSVTPSTESQTIVPDAGYYGISKVTVEAVGESGGGSMFASSASGILPTVYRGTASSEFTLDFESSAVGALS